MDVQSCHFRFEEIEPQMEGMDTVAEDQNWAESPGMRTDEPGDAKPKGFQCAIATFQLA